MEFERVGVFGRDEFGGLSSTSVCEESLGGMLPGATECAVERRPGSGSVSERDAVPEREGGDDPGMLVDFNAGEETG